MRYSLLFRIYVRHSKNIQHSSCVAWHHPLTEPACFAAGIVVIVADAPQFSQDTVREWFDEGVEITHHLGMRRYQHTPRSEDIRVALKCVMDSSLEMHGLLGSRETTLEGIKGIGTVKGAETQKLHEDYKRFPKKEVSEAVTPLSAIWAATDVGFKLWNKKNEAVHVPSGSIVVFTASYQHKGDAHRSTALRVHGYVKQTNQDLPTSVYVIEK